MFKLSDPDRGFLEQTQVLRFRLNCWIYILAIDILREKLYHNVTRAHCGIVQRLLQRLENKGYVERDRSLPIYF